MSLSERESANFLIIAFASPFAKFTATRSCSDKSNGQRSSLSLSLAFPLQYRLLVAQKNANIMRGERVYGIEQEAPWGHPRSTDIKLGRLIMKRLLPGAEFPRKNIISATERGKRQKFAWVLHERRNLIEMSACGFLRFYIIYVCALYIYRSARSCGVFIVYGLSNIRSTFCSGGPPKVRSSNILAQNHAKLQMRDSYQNK